MIYKCSGNPTKTFLPPIGFILPTECLEQANPVNANNKTELLLNVEDMTMQYSLE